MKPVIISLLDEHPLLKPLAHELSLDIGKIILHKFPDQETFIRFETELKKRELIILTSLDRPDEKILPLLFVAETAKELGAKRVGLCAPYLAYMRQDKRFHPGEAVTSTYFAELLSRYFDWMITVDPHLHRHHNLNEIYTIPNMVLHAAPLVSEWIAKNIDLPLVVGPDSESEQWVREVAVEAKADYLILEKIRYGDKRVKVSEPEVSRFLKYTPVLVDDIISTAETMIESVHHLKKAKMKLPVCIGIHPIFAENSYQTLLGFGVKKVVTCNTIPHPSNQIDVLPLLCEGINQHIKK